MDTRQDGPSGGGVADHRPEEPSPAPQEPRWLVRLKLCGEVVVLSLEAAAAVIAIYTTIKGGG